MNSSPVNRPENSISLPKAILFDYDGVLVASEIIHISAWKQLLEELNLPHDPILIQQKAGRIAPEILSELLDLYRPGWTNDEFDVIELAKRKSAYYLPMAQTSLLAYPGVYEGLRWLKENQIAMAVVSNARRKELQDSLKRLELFPFFETVFSRDDLPKPKPDPEAYLLGAASLGINPDECIVVEDSPTGLESALLGKIPAAAVTTNFKESELSQPVPGRPDLRPTWIGPSIHVFFEWLKTLKK